MRVSSFALLTLLTLAGLRAQAQDIGAGNGGGGVNRNGRYMTFYSAGLWTAAGEEDISTVPQLADLVDFFNQTGLLGVRSKVAYAKALTPTPQRKYYKVDGSRFTPEIRERLIAEYSRVMRIETQEVALFAITDTTSRTTYLLPEFYKLTANEQKAILFHEAFWVAFPDATYPAVISAETSFQSFLEKPKSIDRVMKWLTTSGGASDRYAMALNTDLSQNNLLGFVDRDSRVKLADLVGEEFINCKRTGGGDVCAPYLAAHAYKLSRQFPNSQFVKFYASALSEGSLKITFSDCDVVARCTLPIYRSFNKLWSSSVRLKDAIFEGEAMSDFNGGYYYAPKIRFF